jgi:S-adenosylmethionine-diacylgycerolhomoserine-N-methlytransferase
LTVTAALDHGGLMDRVYRRQRHLYDATRKFYLLGRDPMLAGLRPPESGSVLEIGCGTGRNLVKAARLYPSADLFGIDISREMLATAGSSIAAAGLRDRIRIACSDAALFDPAKTFGREKFDRIFISYAVSMIPEWRAVMRAAARHLAPGGELHVVDFGDQDGLPGWFRTALYRWLGWFHVTPRGDLFELGDSLAEETGGTAEARSLHHGFAWIATVRRTDRTPELVAAS